MIRAVGTALGLSISGLVADTQPGLTLLDTGFRDASPVLAGITLPAVGARARTAPRISPG